jgi:uncharacterized ferritin-like protein (DUF455 family)
MTSLSAMAVEVLTTADGRRKTALGRAHAATWFAARAAGTTLPVGDTRPPDRPARPARPELLAPKDVPRRRPGSPAGRIALLHAVAHIELNAVDLHWDIIARFADQPMPPGFYDDWVKAADEEAKHFNLICDCLEAMGSHYGALPAHAGMWRAAEDTATDLAGRLAVVPMVLEARGLDVTPATLERVRASGDANGARILERILDDEIRHVAAGTKHFVRCAETAQIAPESHWQTLVKQHFHGAIKPPFNDSARLAAGLSRDFYTAIAS